MKVLLMLRHVLIFGLVGGALVVVLRLSEYRFLVIEHSVELYAALIAAIFAAFGIWLGIRLTASRPGVAAVQMPQPAGAAFMRNEKKRDELSITPRELEILELVAAGPVAHLPETHSQDEIGDIADVEECAEQVTERF